ncbi:hypothetical protein PRELSG_0704100 [Plasmodium relictum]|uniref:Uncharacterized protein n=1 Tax=Plasmodium relictum TaxID=85471 RepID=A0A1J1H319_PLARL|nr:hypothetical protein PRELSG_0704100 [Plasmodium relictum]CRG99277.1 hypothetical protein PRELSG_0704100 [Plasmodium relictum]
MHFSKYISPTKITQNKYFYSKFSNFIKKNFYIFKKKVLKENLKNKLFFKKNNENNLQEKNIIETKSFLNDLLSYNNSTRLKSNDKSNNLKFQNFHLSEQLIIYNIILKNNLIENIEIEILFKKNNITVNEIENFYYLEIFYKRLKSNKIENKLINLYRSKINNIYSNLLFYHFNQKGNNFLLHNNIYKQFSHVLYFIIHEILNINILLFKKKITKSEYVKKKFYKVSETEKLIQNYIFKLLNNFFINNFLLLFRNPSNNLTKHNEGTFLKRDSITKNRKYFEKNENRINEKQLFYINKLNKNKIKLDLSKSNKNNTYDFRRTIEYSYKYANKKVKKKNCFKFKLDFKKKHHCLCKQRSNIQIFEDFNILKLNSIFLKAKNGNNSDLLKITFKEFLIILSRKRKDRKNFLSSIIKCYAHFFTFSDIFIVDKENVNKFFFFFYYHSLNSGYTIFFHNRTNINMSKKNSIEKKRKGKIKSFNYNTITNFLKRKKLKKKKKNQYFINLNNNKLKNNSSDNYILLFLYDLIFNMNFHFNNYLKYKYSIKNIDKKYAILNKKVKNKVKKGRIILFTNDKKMQSMCFKINVFYQNCCVEENNKNKNSAKLYVFSDNFLNRKKNDKQKNKKATDSYELYAFSKTFHF